LRPSSSRRFRWLLPQKVFFFFIFIFLFLPLSSDPSALPRPVPDFKYKVTPDSQLFTKTSENFSVNQVYLGCIAPPNLQALDRYREDGQPCMKLYSYPQFFLEQWLQLMAKEDEEKRKAKAEKKKKKTRVCVSLSRLPVTPSKLTPASAQIDRI